MISLFSTGKSGSRTFAPKENCLPNSNLNANPNPNPNPGGATFLGGNSWTPVKTKTKKNKKKPNRNKK